MSVVPADRLKKFLFDAHDDASADLVTIDRFEIVRRLGRGGMASVYEAYDPRLKRSVALKVLERGTTERLAREATIASSLVHPNIVTTHEVGDRFIVMELVDGKSFAHVAGTMTIAERLGVLETVARAVGFAHGKGIIHRDLKPDNVLIDRDGRVVLTDFGLAKVIDASGLTHEQAVLGTPSYMAPEQATGAMERLGPWTDVWALGVMLFEAVAGQRPFRGETASELCSQILASHPNAPRCKIESVIAKALAKDPGDRYADANSLVDDLERARTGRKTLARALKGRPGVARLGIAAAILVLTTGAFALHRQRRAAQQQDAIARAEVALAAGLSLVRAGSDRQADRLWAEVEAAAQADAASPEFAVILGRMERARGRHAQALAHQERALASNPTLASARYERAVLLTMRHGRLVESAIPDATETTSFADWERSLGSSRSDASAAWRALAEVAPATPISAAAAAYFDGRHKVARDAAGDVLRADPTLDEASSLLAMAATAEQWGRDDRGVDERLAALSASVAAAPEDASLRIERAALLDRRSRVRRTQDQTLADLTSALGDLDAVLARDPSHAQARAARGGVVFASARIGIERGKSPLAAYDEAERDLSLALARDPGQGDWWWARGKVRRDRASHLPANEASRIVTSLKEADEDLSRALRIGGDRFYFTLDRAVTRGRLAAVLAHAGDDAHPWSQGADEDFAAARALRPSSGLVDLHRAFLSRQEAERAIARHIDEGPALAESRRHIDASLRHGRTDPYIWAEHGKIAFLSAQHAERRGGRQQAGAWFSEAARDYVEAIALRPNSRAMWWRELMDARVRAYRLASD